MLPFRYSYLIIIGWAFMACQKGEKIIPNPPSLLDSIPYELVLPEGFPAPEIPADNALTLARVQLGKRLFYDPILSKDFSVSCASCHRQELAFSDNKKISEGVDNRLGQRNAPSLANVAYLTKVNKDGGVPKLDLQALVPIEDKNEMALSINVAADRLNEHPEYRNLFIKAYGQEANSFTITRALAAFQRTLISGHSRFDQYSFQNQGVLLSESELRGMALFFSARTKCSHCHNGVNFSDNSFQNNGTYEVYDDKGQSAVTINPADEGKFRVASLRNVGLTAPYMHDGHIQTLQEVIEHYNLGGKNHPNKSPVIKPLGLNDQEKDDLLLFLHTLTDSSFIQNPAFKPN